jgi:hypothetical protein
MYSGKIAVSPAGGGLEILKLWMIQEFASFVDNEKQNIF